MTTKQETTPRTPLRHPFDTATGTLLCGALLTAVLVVLVRHIAG
jgi:hypothetical protein